MARVSQRAHARRRQPDAVFVIFDFLRKSNDYFFCSKSFCLPMLDPAGSSQGLRLLYRRWLRRRFWLRGWLDFQAVTDHVPDRRRLYDLFFGTKHRQLHKPIRDNAEIRIHAPGLTIKYGPQACSFSIAAGNLSVGGRTLGVQAGLLDLGRKVIDVLV